MKAVTAGNDLACDLSPPPLLHKGKAGHISFDPAIRTSLAEKRKSPPDRQSRLDQVLHHLVLAIDRDRTPARQLRQVDSVCSTRET